MRIAGVLICLSFLSVTFGFTTIHNKLRLTENGVWNKHHAMNTKRGTKPALSRLKLQKNPHSQDAADDKLDIFSIFRDSFKDAIVARKTDSAFGGKAELNTPLLLVPLLGLPVWAAVVAFGLFMPSPEVMLNAFSSTQIAYSAPWDAAPEISKVTQQVSQALPFGTSQGGINLQDLANPQLDPSLFVPVCKFSDTFYRGAKNGVLALAGKDVYQEYAPLIAGSLLRVRLEFCVLESFVYESIIPFIKARGLSWVFPLRETLETFVAGVVFAVASNVVLIGSTKIISIAIFYSDFFIGLPIRLTFGFINDRLVKSGAGKNPAGVVLIAGTGAIRLIGQTTEVARKFIEFWDVFVGRYLLLTTFGYVVRFSSSCASM